MRITLKDQSIKSFEEWEKHIPKHHWKKGRSAYSLAYFMMKKNGADCLYKVVGDIIGENVSFTEATVEDNVPFDNYPNGTKRDLVLTGRTDSGKNVFVTVEAKVCESFGAKTSSAYQKAKLTKEENPDSKRKARIEELVALLFNDKPAESIDVGYQLLYSTAATLKGPEVKKLPKGTHRVMLVLIFKTEFLTPKCADKNCKDFGKFMGMIKAKEATRNGTTFFKTTIKGKPIVFAYQTVDATQW